MSTITYPKLYQKDQTGKIRYWYMQRYENQYRSISGIQGREDTSEQISAWTEVKEGTNIGKVNEKSTREQAAFLVNRMYEIRKEQGYAEDLKDAGKKFFQPMLAAKYFGLNEKKRNELFKTERVYRQPKLDGCVSGDMAVDTDEGRFTLREVVEQGKGTAVLSYNISKKQVEYKKILGRYKNGQDIQNPGIHRWFKITLSDGKVLKLTGNHRIFLPELKCWRRVDELSGTEKVLSV